MMGNGSGDCHRRSVVHGTAVALDGRGILLVGPSGSGKSDLALRLIAQGARLVADDAVVVEASDVPQSGRLAASALPGAVGRLMVDGIGVVMVPAAERPVLLSLAIRLGDSGTRQTEGFATLSCHAVLQQRSLPCVSLAAFDGSCCLKVKLALERWGF